MKPTDEGTVTLPPTPATTLLPSVEAPTAYQSAIGAVVGAQVAPEFVEL